MIRKLLISFGFAASVMLPATAQTTAITGGKVWTGSDRGTIENANVLIQDGRIVAVGPANTVSTAAADTIIDADGNWVTPGIIVPYSQIGIVEVGAEDSTNDTTAALSAYSVSLDAVDAFNPSASSVDVTRIEGVTRVAVSLSPTGNLFGGQGFVTDTSGDLDSDIAERAFLYVSLDEQGAALSGGSRAAAWTQLQAAMDDARTFPARYLAHNEGTALKRADARAFGPAVRGQQLIMINANRAIDLKKIMDFKLENPALQLAILGADEGWLVAEDLAASGIPVIIDPFQNLPASFSQLAATSENAQRLLEAGVEVAFVHLGFSGHQARLSLQVAGNAVANGVSHDDALKALTVTPARILGLDGLGTVSTGAVADIVIWDGDPLEVTSSPTLVMIAGEQQSLESRQTRLRDRYIDLDESNRPMAYKRPD